jgi:hypothetical protein
MSVIVVDRFTLSCFMDGNIPLLKAGLLRSLEMHIIARSGATKPSRRAGYQAGDHPDEMASLAMTDPLETNRKRVVNTSN